MNLLPFERVMLIFQRCRGGEARVRAFGTSGPSVPVRSFGPARAYVLGVLFGASRAFVATGAPALGLLIVCQHADESWVWKFGK